MAKNEINKEDLIRVEILAAARSLFQRFGLVKTTMEDIAKSMNKGKSTLYYYYKNKDEIFEAVVSNEIRDVFREIRSAVENAMTAEEKLRIYFLTAIRSIQKRILLYQIMKGEIGENLKTIVNLKYKMDNSEVQFIREILAFGLKNKEWVAEIEPDLDLIAYSIVSALRGITLDLVVEERFPHWDERIGVLSEIFLRGLKR
jgi:AcrR family transcriptional regulator